MIVRFCTIALVALATSGCFQQKAPRRPVIAATLEEGLKNPAAIEFLDLHYQPGFQLPADLGRFTAVTQLSLRGAELATAPEGIKTLSKLNWLDLGENKLEALPDPALMSAVKTLYLNDNALTALPPSIGSLTQLTYLNLDRNRLTVLPAEIGNLPNLAYLRLSGNQLTALPDSVANLKNLKRLYLKGNPLPEPEKERITKLLPQVLVIW
jgi:Leucine-rich repeat (LRR) protein